MTGLIPHAVGPLGLIKKMTSFQITTITTEFENTDGVEAVYVVGEEEGDVGLHHLDGWDEVHSNQVESRVPGAGNCRRKGMGGTRCWAHGEQTEPTALARAWAAWRIGEELDNYTTGDETLTFSKKRRAMRRTTGRGREISLAFIRQKVVHGEEQQRESHGGGKLDNPRDATKRDQSPHHGLRV